MLPPECLLFYFTNIISSFNLVPNCEKARRRSRVRSRREGRWRWPDDDHQRANGSEGSLWIDSTPAYKHYHYSLCPHSFSASRPPCYPHSFPSVTLIVRRRHCSLYFWHSLRTTCSEQPIAALQGVPLFLQDFLYAFKFNLSASSTPPSFLQSSLRRTTLLRLSTRISHRTHNFSRAWKSLVALVLATLSEALFQ